MGSEMCIRDRSTLISAEFVAMKYRYTLKPASFARLISANLLEWLNTVSKENWIPCFTKRSQRYAAINWAKWSKCLVLRS